jgi:hypothetical protein
MGLPDPTKSAAVVMGVATYRQRSNFPAIPAATNNALALARILADPTIGHLTQDRCFVVTDPVSPTEVITKLRKAARSAQDTFTIYFAGHGELGRDGKFYLILKNTNADNLRYSALDFDSIREVMKDCPARRRLLIVDCCFSGNAVAGYMSGKAQGIFGLVETSGTYTLASAGPNAKSTFRPGEPYTAFTGELIALLEDGLPGHGEFITVDQLYPNLKQRLESGGYPRPVQGLTDSVKNLALTRNPSHSVRESVSRDPGKSGDGGLAGSTGMASTGISWISHVDTNRDPDFTSSPPPLPSTDPAGCGGGVTSVMWAVAAGLLAWGQWPSALFITLLLAGIVSIVLYAATTPASRARIAGALMIAAQLVTYCAMAIGFGRSSQWGLMAAVIMTTILFGASFINISFSASERQWIAELREKEKSKSEHQRIADHIRKSTTAQKLKVSRWLGEARSEPVFDSISYLPGARFIQMRRLAASTVDAAGASAYPSRLRTPDYAIACGKNVVAVYYAQWPAASYRRMAGATKEVRRGGRLFEQGRKEIEEVHVGLRALQRKVKKAQLMGLVLIDPAPESSKGKKKESAHSNPPSVEISEQNLHKSDLVIANQSGAAEAIGSFLAQDPYVINLDVISALLQFSSAEALEAAGLSRYGSRSLTE